MKVTRELADYIAGSRAEDVPEAIRDEAKRAILNFVGCALGGSRHRAVDIALEALGPYAGPPASGVLGRPERTDPLLASLLNGISSHVHDYDDTTPSNYIHATSPVASAMFAYAGTRPVTGRDFLHAFILGFETVSRIGNATYPAHYDAGWHSTGSVGVFGAAAALARLLGLEGDRMVWALGLAATQSAGLREMFGSMAKSFHPGRSAQSGYMSALLAQAGFTTGASPLEGPRGFAAVEATEYDLSKVTRGLGETFELTGNTYKPFPCGIVIHPTIDACIQIRTENKLEPSDVSQVRLRVAPLVKDLCDKKAIETGLQGKFSVYHAAALGLARGKAGLAEFTDEAVNDPSIRRIREIVEASADPAISEDGVHVEVRLASGRVITKQLEHSLGNLNKPLSDRQLEEKFLDQSSVLPEQQARELIAHCWAIDRLDDVGMLAALAVPRK